MQTQHRGRLALIIGLATHGLSAIVGYVYANSDHNLFSFIYFLSIVFLLSMSGVVAWAWVVAAVHAPVKRDRS